MTNSRACGLASVTAIPLGSKRSPGVLSYARRLRHWLREIHVDRFELHNDTAAARRVDWHSYRRGFCTELALKNVNTARAMKLAGHKAPHAPALRRPVAGPAGPRGPQALAARPRRHPRIAPARRAGALDDGSACAMG
jgi:hypothetical protein